MARYIVQHKYHAFSDAQHWGPWSKGAVVELDDDRAEWVNRDVPGTLLAEDAVKAAELVEAQPEPADADEPGTEPEAEPEAEKPARNRKHSPGRTRA